VRYLVIVFALALAAIGAGSASAGGWATVGLASMPEGVSSGETWMAEITILRHGVTPTDGAAPNLTIRNKKTGASETFDAEPGEETGVYIARVVFPDAGTWSFEIDNGLAATGYGESAATTYAPVTIAAGSDGTEAFRALPFGILAAAIVLPVAGVFGVRHFRRPTPEDR
jgi:hypothetical protein